MTPETLITIQMISTGICIGVCLVILIGAAFDIIMSKRPGKTPPKQEPRRDNFISCARTDCVYNRCPAPGFPCGKDRTYITSDGKCKSYVARSSSGEE